MKNRVRSFRYAFKGIAGLFYSEPNARIHLIMTILVLILGFLFTLSPVEWALIALAIGLVFAAEAFNTALEHLVDLVSPEYNELAGRAKDTAAAAVLFSAMGAAALGLILFAPRIWNLFAG
ncbi:MAG: diacylglycerol kinase family protein [Phaeodactylibacter sp.]|nr:diacylglycerol kinase family protein [Phaeodactylibacter sp.]MCB9264585.1 diacylglycerol kinase family protein [Lewinellaceae bacterium]MCB9287312.1 diacylglycerol kinase family protein [Lewinellaceae bacterium]